MAEQSKTSSVLAVVDDMFFASKIRGAAETVGRTLEFAKSRAQLEEKLGAQTPSLIIIDLNSGRLDPIETIKFLKGNPDSSRTRIVGFLSHVQVDLMQQARAAGCDDVMPRSAFSQHLNEILS